MAAKKSDKSQKGKQKANSKSRSPVERIVVWGGILLLLALVATEGYARYSYTTSLEKLRSELQKDEAGDREPLTVEEAKSLIVGSPAESTAGNRMTFQFRGLIKDFGSIHLTFDPNQMNITGLETEQVEEEPVEEEPVEEGAE
ncbi:hypothetical protein KOR42_29170 [Thalassoglobus neptunius]|uniref:Uncharacterized protein n=1 Tax=Thalassoglobus neptunius TaxID=1938619 RepID=A0A5C5WXJ3_9PLAN|nr:hypothetical protein [Thalassoglobus neptunius]TWT55290.1 hypothetical protein KOR42_29170 [Thalassoglobus neptunius]